MRSSIYTPALLMAAVLTAAQPLQQRDTSVILSIPANAAGASIPHSPSFSSYSMEPAFWEFFVGNTTSPNEFFFTVINQIVAHGGQPIIRPGGDTMDSMIFDPTADGVVRVESASGGVYRTIIGPDFFKSWDLFPAGTKFISTLDFENDTLDTARDMALAAVKYQKSKILYFELGNEPTNYPYDRWDDSAIAYVDQWKNWTAEIDLAVNATISPTKFGSARWLASSATTDQSGLYVRPVDIIPLGVDSNDQVAEYSIHSYPFSTCDPTRAALATIPGILNHTTLVYYAEAEIGPSAQAALNSGGHWIVGEFNSISCSGRPGVSDTFAQALWVVDSELIYAVMNASAVHLHQGATLVFQSSDQSNTPGFSSYDFLYPISSPQRGPARVLPSFVGQLFLAEAFSTEHTQVTALDPPAGVDADYFSAYAFYVGNKLSKIAVLNMMPVYANATAVGASNYTLDVDVSGYGKVAGGGNGEVRVKRMTSPGVDTQDASLVTWAGQSFPMGEAVGSVDIETVGSDGVVSVRGSEGVLLFFGGQTIVGE